MSDTFRWRLLVIACSVLLGVIMQGPLLLHSMHPLWEGIPVRLNSDEEVYLARVQEALSGRPEQSTEAFTGHENLVGTQPALIESTIGTLFAFTGFRAATVLSILDSVIPMMLFVALVFFFRCCRFERKYALLAAIAFCMIGLYNLNRPIHLRSSFLPTMGVLICTMHAACGKKLFAIIGGVFLGVLLGTYFWSFAFAWAFVGVYLVWELVEYLSKRSSSIFPLAMIVVVGLLVSLPFVLQMFEASQRSVYEYAYFRSGIFHSRAPESWIYSILFTAMLMCTCINLKLHYEKFRPHRSAVVTLLAVFIFMHQQVVHGLTFKFVSHGLFSLMLAALCTILLALHVRTKWSLVASIAAAIYLAGIAYDGRYVLNQWRPNEAQFIDQHLSTALLEFDALERIRILSDPDTSALIASHTHHDIVYSIYLKNILMTHTEIAARFCLTQLPLAPEDRGIEDRWHLVFPDATESMGGDLRKREVDMVLRACREIDLDPNLALSMFEVDYIFWNKVREPDWNLSRLNLTLEEVVSDDTWTLYRINR